ncbi:MULTISPECIES: MliC family protein [Eikenella]|uniref:C-type lysozyme inhibitor domain-containing protein n=1 Tax=Eikenella longinqua TaxID=1795827 RepID=A0A1A9RY24_9NEIS|nr:MULTISPECIES: MliC family protein [Eikenella]OAM28405.1 hypothetical protein A7P95_05440 [Eikenella longinqua]
MKVRTWAVPASLALLLTACAAPMHADDGDHNRPPPHRYEEQRRDDMQDRRDDRDHQRRPRHERHGRQGIERFSCENGLSVSVRQEGTGRVSLQLDDKRAVLTSAVAASGERYTSNRGLFGSGAEWHRKGNEAVFSFKDPYGNQVETSCQRR